MVRAIVWSVSVAAGCGAEFPTKINEEIKYRPVVAAIESTMFLKRASVKTSEKLRPLFSFERPSIPLYAMNIAANWRKLYQNGKLVRSQGVPSPSYKLLGWQSPQRQA